MSEAEESEQVLWTMLAKFERLALDKFEAFAPELVTEGHRAFVTALEAEARAGLGDESRYAESEVGEVAERVLALASTRTMESTLLVQGLALEPFALVLYGALARNERTSEATRRLAAEGGRVSAIVADAVVESIRQRLGTEGLFARFADATSAILSELDAVAETADETLAAPLGLDFNAMQGAIVADIVQRGLALGMQRKHIMGHLSSALMGM